MVFILLKLITFFQPHFISLISRPKYLIPFKLIKGFGMLTLLYVHSLLNSKQKDALFLSISHLGTAQCTQTTEL